MSAYFTSQRRLALSVVALSLAAAANARAGFTPTVLGGTPATASIQPTVDAFRTLLGDPNNGNNPGPLAGRREINWDGGGGDIAATQSGSTLSAFTNTRGATMVTLGTGFLQTQVTDPLFTAIQPSYASAFAAFSTRRIFTPLGSNITDIFFFLPGSNGATTATVMGFGAVFSDVDVANTTKIEFFDVNDAMINLLFVPSGDPTTTLPGPKFSFAGAIANAGEKIAHVRITTGNQALGLSDNSGDPVELVVMDDFLYSEPVGVPEPASASLAVVALLAAAGMTRARHRT